MNGRLLGVLLCLLPQLRLGTHKNCGQDNSEAKGYFPTISTALKDVHNCAALVKFCFNGKHKAAHLMRELGRSVLQEPCLLLHRQVHVQNAESKLLFSLTSFG